MPSFRYTLEINGGANKANFRLCRLKILQIGSNYPCAKDVTNTLDEAASTVLKFDGTDTYTGGETYMTYEFPVRIYLKVICSLRSQYFSIDVNTFIFENIGTRYLN